MNKTLNTQKSILAGLVLAVLSILSLPLSTANAAPGDLDSMTPAAGGFWEFVNTSTVRVNSRVYRISYP